MDYDRSGTYRIIKIDFLGLRNLSIIHQIILQVKKDLNINIDIEAIPYDDKKCLIYYQMGTLQVFFNWNQKALEVY